jgi:hypothetical protein
LDRAAFILEPWVDNPRNERFDSIFDLRTKKLRGMLDMVHGNMSNVVFFNMEEYRTVGATKWMTKLANDYNLKIVSRPPKNGAVLVDSGLHDNCFEMDEWKQIDLQVDWELESRVGLTKEGCRKC